MVRSPGDGTFGLPHRHRISRTTRTPREWRDVLRFDEPSRLHSTASNGIAEYGGWLYFTLSDFQSDIWVASVKGLKK
jgi:hypothetical protein